MQPSPPVRTLLILTFTTGVVDAASFLALGGVFAAMQTGNVIFLGIGAAGVGNAPFLAPLIGLAAFLLGGAIAAAVVREDEGPGRMRTLAPWLGLEMGLLGLGVVLAAAFDVEPGHASAYCLIVLLSLTMGLRNTFVRGTSGPNLWTTVLNLTLTSTTPRDLLTEAGPVDLGERAAGVAAILAGALCGALLIKTSLPLALALAALAALSAALIDASTSREAVDLS